MIQPPDLDNLTQRHVAVIKQPRRRYIGGARGWRHAVLIERLRDGRWEVGYEWVRPYAHYFNGLVNECVLGRGATLLDALRAAERRVVKLEAK